ncbi:High-affinity nickel-transporter [Paenibacillus tarimensis]
MLSFTAVVMLIGFRHGMDMDHIAAITDMVGAERERKKQLLFGTLYALGHGSIIVLVGLAAIVIGRRLSDGFIHVMELGVGLSLLILGLFILYSLVKENSEYRFKSRFQLVAELLAKLSGRKNVSPAAMAKFGILGSLGIGVLHGIGAETPTQIMLFSSAVRLDDQWTAFLQLLLFAVGMLAATLIVTCLASWGFTKAKSFKGVYTLLGSATGLYSIVLGCFIISGA